jgi:hypothetical protein
MKLRNVFYGLFLCSVVSLACAADNAVYQLVEEQVIKINFGETPKSTNKSVARADLGEIEDKQHPLSDIAHPRDEFNVEENQSEEPGFSSALQEHGEQNKELIPVVESHWFASSIKDISKQHMFPLTAGAMFVGYCAYKVWNMFVKTAEQVAEELKITLTSQDREILFAVLQAMAQDIENLRENKHEASAVGQIDLSSLSEILAPECKVLCSNFVELYNAIDRSGNNIEIIIMFYGQFERAVQAVLLQAEII